MNHAELASTFSLVFNYLIHKRWNISIENADGRRFGDQCFTSTYTWIKDIAARQNAPETPDKSDIMD